MLPTFARVIDSLYIYHLTKLYLNRTLVMDIGGLLISPNFVASALILVVGVGKMRTADLVNCGS